MKAFGHSYNSAISNLAGGAIGVLSVVAVLLNMLLFRILNHLRQRGDKRGLISLQLVGLVSVMDLVSGFSGIFLVVARLTLGAPEMFEVPSFCSAVGFLSLFSTGMGGALLVTLGTERYLVICKQTHAKPHVMGAFLGVSCVSLIVLLYKSARDGGLVVDATFSHCVPSDAKSMRAYYWAINIFFLTPVLFLTFFYSAIFAKCLSLDCPSQHFNSRRLSLRALLFLILYLACFSPKLIGALWGLFASRHNRPILLHLLGSLGIVMSMTINPILVFFLNKEIRTAAKEILHLPALPHFP